MIKKNIAEPKMNYTDFKVVVLSVYKKINKSIKRRITYFIALQQKCKK